MEWKRVFCSRKRLGVLFLLTLLCAAVFVYETVGGFSLDEIKEAYHAGQYAQELTERWQDSENISALLHEEMERLWNEDNVVLRNVDALDGLLRQAKHLAGYEDYLQGIQAQAQTMSQAAIFQKNGSFSKRNLEKTARDFLPMTGTPLRFGNHLAIEAWLQDRSGELFFLGGMVLFVFSFLEERKKGLLQIVRSCRRGRKSLVVQRLAILAAASVLCAVLFRGVSLAVSGLLNGGLGDLSRPVQSLQAFQTCTLRLSVGGWLLRYFALRVFLGLVLSTLLWWLLDSFDSIQFPLTILGLILAVELGAYVALPEQSFLSIFKYCNLFSMIELANFDRTYRNLNFFGFPLGKQAVLLTMAALLLAVSVGFLLKKRYTRSNAAWFEWLTGSLRKGTGLLCSRFSLGFWEAYKALRLSFGILFLAVLFIAVWNMDFLVRSPTDPDAQYVAYRTDLLGPLENSEAYFQGVQSDSEAVQRLRDEVSEVKRQATDGGYQPWLVDHAAFDGVYGEYSLGRQRLHALISMLLVVAMCAGIGAFEKQSNMTYLLRSTKFGRKTLKRYKLLISAIYAAVVWATVSAAEFSAYMEESAHNALAAPVQNFIGSFPLPISLGGFLAILYSLRLLMLTAVAWLALGIGNRCKTLPQAYLWAATVLSLPAGLTVIGVERCKWISPIVPVTATELLYSDTTVCAVAFPVLLIIAWLANYCKSNDAT